MSETTKTLLDGFGEASEQVVALRAEVERLTAERIAFLGQGAYSHFQEMERELNDLDTKLGNALRAIGLEHAENERLKAAHGHLWFAITNIVNDFEQETAREVIDELRDLLTEHANRFTAPSGPDHE